MGLFSRAHDIMQAKANKALDKAEKPDEMLDLSYEKMLEQITQVRRALVEIAASRKRIELQESQLQDSADHLQDQARAALGAGREDLAREALTRKAAAQQQIDQMEPQHQQLVDEEGKLAQTLQTLQARVNQFRTQKETLKAQYTGGPGHDLGQRGGGRDLQVDRRLGRRPDQGPGQDRRHAGPLRRPRRAARVRACWRTSGGGHDDIQKELDKIGASSARSTRSWPPSRPASPRLAPSRPAAARCRRRRPGQPRRPADRRRRSGARRHERRLRPRAGRPRRSWRTTSDVHMLLKVLASQLSGAAGRPAQGRAPGRSAAQVRRDQVGSRSAIGDEDFRAELQGRRGDLHRRPLVRRASASAARQVEMDEWLRRLLSALQTEAAHSQAARLALENIVIGGPA